MKSKTLLPNELMARVRQIQVRTHRLVNTALSGGYRSTFRGTGVEFQEVRAYQPGDEVRWIDWNVTARNEQAFVKVFAEERELTLNFVVDTSRSMDFGSRRYTKRETAAHLTALLSLVAMRHQDRVGLALYGDRPGLHLPARKGSQHVLRIVREVLGAEPSEERGSDLAAALVEQERVLRRMRTIVFVVSDFLDAPGSDGSDGTDGGDAGLEPAREPAWVEVLSRLSRRHDVICVRVVDPLERAVPSAGLIDVREIETGRMVEIDSRSRRLREAWAEAAEERRERLIDSFARARADWLEVDTEENVAEAVIAFFRKRQLRHGGAH